MSLSHSTKSSKSFTNDPALPIRVKVVRLLLNGIFPAAINNLLIGTITVVVVRNSLSHRNLLFWVAGFYLLQLMRIALGMASRRLFVETEAARWLVLVRTGALLTGVAWGALPALLFPGYLPYQSLLVFVAAGVTAAAAAAYMADFASTLLFIVPTLAPLIVLLFMDGGETQVAESAMGVLYLAFLVIAAKRSEQAFKEMLELREETERQNILLRKVQRQARLGFWSFDVPSGKLEWSEEVYVINGRDPMIFTPDITAYYRDLVHPDDVAALQRKEQATYGKPGQRHHIDHRVLLPDGSVRWVHLEGTATLDASGNPARIFGVVQDITERKLAEMQIEARTQELSRSNEELKLALERLRLAQSQLVESGKMAALGALVAGVAHEINTPVGIGVTAASALEDETKQLAALYRQGQMKKTDLEQYISVSEQSSRLILNNLARAADLIKSFKQVAVDQTSEERRRFKVKDYLEHILSSLRPALRKAGVSFIIDCEDEIEIDSYPGALSQIITNLVINAITHAFDGKSAGIIRIVVIKSGDQMELEFSDDGKGMSTDTLAKIYDPFFTTKRSAGGSGLGLHIVYNLVTQTLKGGIVCRSQPDQGTTFDIHWPMGSDMNPAQSEL